MAQVALPEASEKRKSKKNLRIWLFAVSLSLFGDCALWLVAALWVKTLTGNDGAAGLVFLAYLAPGAVSPLYAFVVDRVRRRRLLIALNLILAFAVCLALLVRSESDVWLIYLVLVMSGLGSSLHSAAGSAMLPHLVGEDGLGPANAQLRTVKEAARLVAPVIGTALFATVGASWVVVIDAATYLCAGIALLFITVPDLRPVHQVVEPLRRQMSAGIRFVLTSVPLREVAATMVGVLAVFGMIQPTAFALVDDGLHEPVAFVGVLSVCQAVGAVAGGLLSVRLVARTGPRILMLLGILLFLLGHAVLLVPDRIAAGAGFVTIGLGIAPTVVGFYTQMQQHSPDSLRGRVTAVADSLVSLPQLIFITIGSLIIGVVGYRFMIIVMVLIMAISAAYYTLRIRAASVAGKDAPGPDFKYRQDHDRFRADDGDVKE